MSMQNLNCIKCNYGLTDQSWNKSYKMRNLHICKFCESKRIKEYNKNLNQEKINYKIERKRILRLKLRFETMLAYGNECVHCRTNKILFLTLDHINNNGHFDRRSIGAGVEFYAFLKRLGYPGKGTQLQILCHNCNALKEMQLRKMGQRMAKNSVPEIWIKQDYFISKELDKQLWKEAEELYRKLNG